MQRQRRSIRERLRGFTMIELLVVIAIIAILAAAIVPNFIGFDAEARVAATKSNLDTLRSRITLYRAKEGRYPASLDDLLNRTYIDAGVRKPYLKKIPSELITDKGGNSSHAAKRSNEPISNRGGWVYLTDTADVILNIGEPLDSSWGDYENQQPSTW
jgi:general secretion pathway protein G